VWDEHRGDYWYNACNADGTFQLDKNGKTQSLRDKLHILSFKGNYVRVWASSGAQNRSQV
jgi:hypothetical protein